MQFAENQIDLPGIRDVPEAVARVAGHAHSLASCAVDHVALCVEAANFPGYLHQVRQQLPASTVSECYIGDPDSGMRIAEVLDPGSGVHLVLAAPTGSRGQLVEFLDTTGAEGLQHVAFIVPDVQAAVLELAGRGVPFVGGTEAPERAIVEAREGDSCLRQAFTEPLFGAFFIELIERRGIVDLRRRNIDALYALKAQSA